MTCPLCNDETIFIDTSAEIINICFIMNIMMYSFHDNNFLHIVAEA